ncbi:tyrosine-type recombinase/integrase [Oceanimonas pelagia]|uniref:Tyrosine-type recombinase/integrase n=1 Tax=Oceanimonas pelagia TaxID=3028314 RepID=A0AA50QCW6_9GAMM|nr:tyrosine-type recombinase/integrase [Oceanimonas pelagia]WMC11574.1 tyrosine-type recombinase/integrase [Oceanimonas pelagia]
MPQATFKIGAFTVSVSYLQQRSTTGLFYYRRAVPAPLRRHYNGKRELVFSLKTKDLNQASQQAQALALQHNKEFEQLKHNVTPSPVLIIQPASPPPAELVPTPAPEQHTITLNDIKHHALKAHQGNKKKTTEITRCFGYFADLPPILAHIKKRDVLIVVERLKTEQQLKTATIKKAVGFISRQVRLTLQLHDLNISNPFAGVPFDNIKKDAEKRHTFEADELLKVRETIRRKSALVTAQIVGLLYDTGCRNAEIGGLLLDDIKLDAPIPHLVIKPHDQRGLKNDNSERLIPLTGISLEFASIVKAAAQPEQKHAFPRYIKDGKFKGDGCSQAVNKFLSGVVEQGTSHSFRHSLNSRLIESGATEMEIVSLMGWSREGMIHHYGKGRSLEYLHHVLARMHRHEQKKT